MSLKPLFTRSLLKYNSHKIKSFKSFVTETNIQKLKDQSLLKSKAFINGEWINSISEKKFSVLDPATENEIGQVPEMGAKETKNAIKAAKDALNEWSRQPARTKHDALNKWGSLILENMNDLATILTLENGKPFNESLVEIKYGQSFIEWFAEESRRIYGDIIPSISQGQRFLVQKQPIGIAGIITPWNFPNAMITRKISAALAAGCTTVIKPAAETPFSALALADLASRAGIPKGVINIITTNENVSEVGMELTTNPDVRKISFTGSTAVGKFLMEQSSSTLKSISLELGGNAPLIVFDDADIDLAVEGTIASKFRASGQTCISPNRIYVQSSIYAEYASKLSEKVSKFKIGNGFDPTTTHGPLINKKAVEKVKRHVDDSVAKGAEILIGGTRQAVNFFDPTVLTGMSKDMIITSEETFGPIAALYKFENEDEVVTMANYSTHGLAAYFYSRDIGRCWRVAEALEVGMVGVNDGKIGFCETPFGGVKESGFGREGSKYGIEEFLNVKFINFGGI
nr:5206_t:CDS:2 [Entrophospora candida]